MKTFTIETIRGFRPKPCYDPGEYLPGDWSGTAMDILNIRECPPEDRLWVVLHQEILDVKTLHLLACDFAERALPAWEKHSPKGEHFDAPKRAIDTKMRWLKGECTDDELEATGRGAFAAARAVAKVASSSAARVSAFSAACSAAWAAFTLADAAARESAREAAWAADGKAIWKDKIKIVKKYL